jgi:cellulose synthase/poly-beta-1,6-N-acetylglucosamine synthase-like glycosyltransferase
MLQVARPQLRLVGPEAPLEDRQAAPRPLGIEPALTASRRSTVEVSVLIPVLNEESSLRESVAAMLAQDLDASFELLFVDGRSDDRTVEILTELQAENDRIRIFDNPHRTTAHALNVALRAARGRFVARMDAHTAYPAGYLRLGVERLRRGDVDWVTGPQVPVGRGRWSRLVATALSGGLGRGSSDKWQAEGASGPAEWNLTTSVFTGVWRRSTVDALGGWDPEWPVNQDSEMAARLLAQGGRIVCLSAMGAEYAPRDSLRRLGRQYWRYGTYRARTFARHPSSCGPVRLAASLLPLMLLSAVLPGPAGTPGRVLAGLYALAIGVQVARMRPARRDVLPLAAVLVTMHLTWGAGFLQSAVRVLPRRAALRAGAPRPLYRPAP